MCISYKIIPLGNLKYIREEVKNSFSNVDQPVGHLPNTNIAEGGGDSPPPAYNLAEGAALPLEKKTPVGI